MGLLSNLRKILIPKGYSLKQSGTVEPLLGVTVPTSVTAVPPSAAAEPFSGTEITCDKIPNRHFLAFAGPFWHVLVRSIKSG